MNKFDKLSTEQQTKVKKHLYTLFFKDVVSFSFVKKDGTVRPSFGCLDSDVIQKHGYPPKNTEQEPKEKKELPLNLFKYFDTEKKSWRSFDLNTLTEVYQVNFDDLIDKILLED